MGFDISENFSFGGATMSDQGFAIGWVGISETSHALLESLVYNPDDVSEDRPFESIVEAFRFAFALGIVHEKRTKRSGKSAGVAPRQFNVLDYSTLIEEEAVKNSESLGLIISEYAEAGCELIQDALSESKSVLSLID